MKNINIPIYRAKKIDSDEYVIGFYSSAYDIRHYVITNLGVDTKTSTVYQMSTDIHKIDATTLSINFPDMLDSKGNKIFASLNEDGKGGDIVKYEQVMGGILKSSGPEECIVKYCNRDHIIAPFFINAKYKNQKTYMTKEHLQVIGIQK